MCPRTESYRLHKAGQAMEGLFNAMNNAVGEGRRGQQKARVSLYISLWTSAVLLYGLGDLATTQLTLATGGKELNPVFGAMANAFGGGIWGLAIAKMVIISSLIGIFRFGSLRHRWAIPTLLSFVGAGLVTNNLVSYLCL